jgi:hypothetical protein
VVERFVASRADLPEHERELLLGWRNVVEGTFEVQCRDGDALVTENLVDELTYRVHSNMTFAWYPQSDRAAIHHAAYEMTMRHPESTSS